MQIQQHVVSAPKRPTFGGEGLNRPTFGGPLELATRLVEKIDADKLTELVITDVGAMILPRTWIEYSQRGMDAGRETLLREVAGTVANCFLAGWAGWAAIKLMAGNLLNPKSLNHALWIENKHLSVFSKLFSETLKDSSLTSSDYVRKAFIERTLKGLESTDGFVKVPFMKSSGRLSDEAREQLFRRIPSKRISRNSLAQLDTIARKDGLSHEIRLLDTSGKTVISEMRRSAFLQQFKVFNDQIVNRLFPKTVAMTWSGRQKAFQTLMAPNAAKFLPNAKDGLVPYLRRSKIFLSLVPITLTIGASCGVAYFNRWWTEQKNGGEKFFPGEEVFKNDHAKNPQFSGLSNNLLNSLDFEQPGKTATPQNMLIYASNIASRLAASRSWNEFGETARRDILGWLFWFYTTPIIQRAVVALAPRKVRNALLTQTEKPTEGFIKKLNWTVNPLNRWHLTSSAQIKDYLSNPAFKKQKVFLTQARNWRAGASTVGLLTAFFALGIGINLLNIAITRKNVSENKTYGH